jgi:uncharacterized protein (DUF362 family)/NAD-dependent dihydropyrimidine dehydrogenase PreA subunit
MKHPVCLLKCPDYDQVKEALLRAFTLLDVLSLFENRSVFLKVNLMKGASPERALNTHPEFIRAMIQIVRAKGGTVMVGDSSGLLGFTKPAFDAAGITAVVEEEGGELVNIDAGPLVKQEVTGASMNSFWVSTKVLEAEVRVTLPKLKTHTLTQLTGAVKNQLGLLPGGTKPALHRIAPQVENFSRALVAINRAVRFDLAVMDGILALEGGGSDQGKPKRAGVLLASRDFVALDSVAAKIMGMEPSAVPTNTIGKETGLGECDLDRIEIRGDPLTDCIDPFLLPGREFKKIPFVARTVYRIRENIIKPAVVKDKCTQCGQCVEVCPVDAIEMNPLPELQKNCINCFCCYERCPDDAIRLTSPWYFRPFVRKRLAGLSLEEKMG